MKTPDEIMSGRTDRLEHLESQELDEQIIPRRRVLKEVVPSLVGQQPRSTLLPRMDGAR